MLLLHAFRLLIYERSSYSFISQSMGCCMRWASAQSSVGLYYSIFWVNLENLAHIQHSWHLVVHLMVMISDGDNIWWWWYGEAGPVSCSRVSGCGANTSQPLLWLCRQWRHILATSLGRLWEWGSSLCNTDLAVGMQCYSDTLLHIVIHCHK